MKLFDGDFVRVGKEESSASPRLEVLDQIETLEKEIERIDKKITAMCKLSGNNRFPPTELIYNLSAPPVIMYNSPGNDLLDTSKIRNKADVESDEDADWDKFVELRARTKVQKSLSDVDHNMMIEVTDTDKTIKAEIIDDDNKLNKEKSDKKIHVTEKTEDTAWDEFVKERAVFHKSHGKAKMDKRGIRKLFRRIFKRK